MALSDFRLSASDVRISFRMLAKYPGLTIVGGLAFAFAIWLGASAFEITTALTNPRIDLPAGDRLVGLELWDARSNTAERQAAYDLVRWRRDLKSVENLGAFRSVSRNLITKGEAGDPVRLAEVTASAFDAARTAPQLGRALVRADELPGASAVAVIGHDLWLRRFGGDSTVIGREVRLGRAPFTIVGVMPAAFEFPSAFELWTPLHIDEVGVGPRQGPDLTIFGRLADGFSLDEAQSELAVIGQRISDASPETHRDLRPRVMTYARSIVRFSGTEAILIVTSGNLPLILLVILVCGNVGLLMFARAASRETELVVRTALGATRTRLVMQLFSEALVLAGIAAIFGLAAASFGLRWMLGVVEAEMTRSVLPFWFDAGLSPATYGYAALLTVFGAAVAGVVPALKVTRGLGERLKQTSAGAGGLQFGGIWTVVIVLQVAVTVAFPAIAHFTRRETNLLKAAKSGVADERFLVMRLDMDREPPPEAPTDTTLATYRALYQRTFHELEERLLADPAVVGVTYGERLPRMYHPHRLIEIDSGGAAPMRIEWPGYRVSSAEVDPDYFRMFDAPMLAGRDFHSSDLRTDPQRIGVAGASEGRVIVNESFVRLVLGGRNAIGRRVRYLSFEDRGVREVADVDLAPWYEIVGVVPDLGMAIGASVGADPKVAGIYHAASPAQVLPAMVALKVHRDPQAFGKRLREIAAEADPALKLYEVRPLARMNDGDLRLLAFWTKLAVSVSLVAVFLSLAGIYAVMSFTLARRTREIGIRVALGADQRRVLLSVFRRPLTQISIGIAMGGAFTTLLVVAIEGATFNVPRVVALAGYIVLMLALCLTACVVPARRALRIEPAEALRVD